MPHNRPKRKALQKARMAKENKPNRKRYVGLIAHRPSKDIGSLIGMTLAAMGLTKTMEGSQLCE